MNISLQERGRLSFGHVAALGVYEAAPSAVSLSRRAGTECRNRSGE
jgi:hypothetical protein